MIYSQFIFYCDISSVLLKSSYEQTYFYNIYTKIQFQYYVSIYDVFQMHPHF